MAEKTKFCVIGAGHGGMAMVVAIRQALDYSSTMRAVCVCIIGWLVQVALLIILFSIIGRALGTGGAGV